MLRALSAVAALLLLALVLVTVLRPSTTPPGTATGAPTAVASPSPSLFPSPSPTRTGSQAGPDGPAGSWKKVWGDEFSGTRLSSRWVALEGYRTNNVLTSAKNVAVEDGQLVLTRSDAKTGAEVDSARYDGARDGYELQVGDYVEASVLFPGDGTELYNWSAFWASGPDWPAAGEHDIAEVLRGQMVVVYHSRAGSDNYGPVEGYWGDAFHTYGLHRRQHSADVYYDGRLVRSYPTSDNGKGEAVLINVGAKSGRDAFGDKGAVRVDWVRAWRPAAPA